MPTGATWRGLSREDKILPCVKQPRLPQVKATVTPTAPRRIASRTSAPQNPPLRECAECVRVSANMRREDLRDMRDSLRYRDRQSKAAIAALFGALVAGFLLGGCVVNPIDDEPQTITLNRTLDGVPIRIEVEKGEQWSWRM